MFMVQEWDFPHGNPCAVVVLKSFDEARGLALTLSADGGLTCVVDTVGAKSKDPEAMVDIWLFRDGRELEEADIEALRKEAPPTP